MVDPLQSKRPDDSFSVENLDYTLPPSLIAQQPVSPRDHARLLVVDGANAGRLSDRGICDLPKILNPGDLLILNDTRVVRAKFLARRETGGAVGGLFVFEEETCRWRVMLQGSRRLRVGETLTISRSTKEDVSLALLASHGDGQWSVAVTPNGSAYDILEDVGTSPLPPYIHRTLVDAAETTDRERYQTVFAKEPGAIAAPTAGLHFTEGLFDALGERGIETAFVTLHVGLGTFKPIATSDISDHVMHAETYSLPAQTCEAIRACKERGGRVVAVGTTSVRVLESAAVDATTVSEKSFALWPVTQAETDIFIYPPYTFKVVDALVTNFHLPKSTLLALVMAIGGVEQIRTAYDHAVREQYRFYSYGDAMLIM